MKHGSSTSNRPQAPTKASPRAQPINITDVISRQSALIIEMHEDIKKIRKKLFWMTVGGYVKLGIIVLPIVIGVILISPYVRSIIDFFSWGQGADIIESFRQVNELLRR